jgi:TrmH family RNA methyltransferase
MKFKIIFLEPEYELNIGLAARLLKNFKINQMHLVNPKCILGFSARMYAKHAANLIKKAKIYKSLREAIKDCQLVIGTTGVPNRFSYLTSGPITLRDLKKNLEQKKPKGKIAIILGRESVGLKKEEVKLCDLLVTIPTSKNYPVLNITNALAIILYELSNFKLPKKKGISLCSKKELDYIKSLINKKIDRLKIKDKEKIKNTIFAFLLKKFPTSLQAKALIYLLKD